VRARYRGGEWALTVGEAYSRDSSGAFTERDHRLDLVTISGIVGSQPWSGNSTGHTLAVRASNVLSLVAVAAQAALARAR
jgi:hypothetical protein